MPLLASLRLYIDFHPSSAKHEYKSNIILFNSLKLNDTYMRQ